MSTEGIEVSKDIPSVELPAKKQEVTVEIDASVKNKGHFLSEDDKEKILEELRAQVEEERKQIIEEATDKAKAATETILREAREKGYEEGYEDGFLKGEEDGFKRGQEKIETEEKAIIDSAYKVLNSANMEAVSYFERQKEKILMLSGKMAEKIVNGQIDTNSQTILNMVNPLIVEFRNGGTVIISCSEGILDKIRDSLPSLREINKDLDYMVIANPKLSGYEFTLEYGNQIIETGIKKQIEAMIEELVEMEV